VADDNLAKFHRFDLNRIFTDIFDEELKAVTIVRNKYNVFEAIFRLKEIIYRSHRHTGVSRRIINKK